VSHEIFVQVHEHSLSIILRFEMDHLVSDGILQCLIPIAQPLVAISLGRLVFGRVITFRLQRHRWQL
jgi:hypothetical protein